MKRSIAFLLVAIVPMVALAIAFPERLLKGTPTVIPFLSVKGADLTVFYQEDCPYCNKFKEFALEKGWPVEYHDVTSYEAQNLFKELQKHAPALGQGVPTIYLAGHVFQGFESQETTGARIEGLYNTCREQKSCLPFDEFLASERIVEVESGGAMCTGKECELDAEKFTLDLWIFGKVDLLFLSLPSLSLLLGFLDGFNPCAMWVLIMLLTLLIATRDMRKVWVIGGTFLFVSAAMYYLFIAAWLNVFLLIGYNLWVQKIIGTVAILGGGFYLYEAFGRNPEVCRVTDHRRRQKIIQRMKDIVTLARWPAMIIGVAILAISVNLIELVCTAGLPAIFTQILAINDVSLGMKYFYLFLYILMYMIDDLAIFAIAVYTLHATGLTTKYRRFTLIFGGVLMYILGILLIFWPEALMFK